MSFIAWAIGAAVVSGVVKGGAAAGWWGGDPSSDIRTGRQGAANIRAEKEEIARGEAGLRTRGAESAWALASRQYGTTSGSVRRGATEAFGGIKSSAEGAYSKAGLATSGTIAQKQGREIKSTLEKYKSDMAKLFDTKKHAEEMKDISISQSGIELQKDYISAEAAYQDQVSGIEADAGPTDFWSGFFG